MTALSSWGAWIDETLIAPGATPGERLLGYGAGVAGALFAGCLAAHAGFSFWALLLVAAVGFDVFGGIVVNATRSGSRRFHGPNTRKWSALGFVAAHVHPFVLALLLPQEMPWLTAIVMYSGIALATVLVILAPEALRQPVAFAAAALLIAMAASVFPTAPVIIWILLLLIVKLLLSHLLPHVEGE
jgi:hypothetical protein